MARRSTRTELLTGVEGLIDSLEGITEAVRSEIIGEMVNAMSKPVVRAIKRLVPVDEGNLKQSIKAVVRKSRKKGTALAVVGPSTERFKNRKKVKVGSDYASWANSEQPSRYAHVMEFGFVKRDGTSHPGKPFMRPGTQAAQQQAADMAVVGFQKGLTKAARKHVKKISK